MEWKLAKIAELAGGKILVGDHALMCSDPVWDSRRVTAGAIFVPLRGENADGHAYLQDAWHRGAVASFVQSDYAGEKPAGMALIQVADPLAALQQWARAYLNTLPAKVVAVTGSIGKTSTKEMVAAVLSTRYRVGKTKGNLNTEMGLPQTVLQATPDLDVLVLEMGMRGPGEILELTSIAPPDVAVITNVGVSHIELLGSRENIARAKGEVLQGMQPDGVAVLNGDDELVASQAGRAPGRVIWFGQKRRDQDDALWADQIVDSGDSLQFVVHFADNALPVSIPWPGQHNLNNSLAAVAVGLALDMSLSDCVRGLANYRPADNRLNLRQTRRNVLLIDDTYNAGPDSVRAALQVLATYPRGGRRLAVLGDMLELGDLGPAAHREVGVVVASLHLDGLVTVGELGALVAQSALDAGLPAGRVASFSDNGAVIAHLEQSLQPGDLVLIKGSRGMRMEQIVWHFAEDRGAGHGH